jgi:hypothetical protein
MYQTTENEAFFKSYARLLATSLAAAINSVVIEASGMIFQVDFVTTFLFILQVNFHNYQYFLIAISSIFNKISSF